MSYFLTLEYYRWHSC